MAGYGAGAIRDAVPKRQQQQCRRWCDRYRVADVVALGLLIAYRVELVERHAVRLGDGHPVELAERDAAVDEYGRVDRLEQCSCDEYCGRLDLARSHVVRHGPPDPSWLAVGLEHGRRIIECCRNNDTHCRVECVILLHRGCIVHRHAVKLANGLAVKVARKHTGQFAHADAVRLAHTVHLAYRNADQCGYSYDTVADVPPDIETNSLQV